MTNSDLIDFADQPITGDVLVVDDTPDNVRLLSSLLTRAGHRVRKVTDGRWAIQAALLSPPDLILLDIVMPDMSGYEVCRLLKGLERTRDIPIIFLSVNDEPLDKVQAFRFGGVDYITKPFESAEVLVRVETQLKLEQFRKQVREQNLRLQSQNLHLHQTIHEQRTMQAAPTPESREDQAQHSDDRLFQLIAALSQEFNSPLAMIYSAVTRLKQSIAPTSTTPEDAHLQDIIRAAEQVQRILEDKLVRTKPDTLLTLEPLDLTQFCASLIARWPRSTVPQVVFTPRDDATLVAADADLLRQMLTSLLHSVSAVSDRVTVELVDQPPQILIEFRGQDSADVAASAAEMPPAQPPAQTSADGLEMTIVKWIAELHNGTVTTISPTRVTVSLPQLPLEI